eukprot:3016002-Amphidinium_carterae.1
MLGPSSCGSKYWGSKAKLGDPLGNPRNFNVCSTGHMKVNIDALRVIRWKVELRPKCSVSFERVMAMIAKLICCECMLVLAFSVVLAWSLSFLCTV